MKIIVRAPNWIGDSILAVPTVACLSRNYPQAQIWIAAKEWVKDIFSFYDFINGIIPLPDANNFQSLWISAKKIKEHHFDIGLLLTNSFSSGLLFYLAKIPQRWGYRRDGRSLLLTKSIALKNQDAYKHQVNYYLDLIAGIGLKTFPPQIALPLTQEEEERAKEIFSSLSVDPQKPLVMLNLGAAYGPAKRWPGEKFAELAHLLQERKKAEILVVGSQDEAELAETIGSLMKKKPHNLTGKTSLHLLAALISKADLFITNDSGPMHIANALKIPLVAIFGPTDPLLTGPFQEPSVVIKKDVACWPCNYRECPYDHRCMTSIKPEEVFHACQKFLQ